MEITADIVQKAQNGDQVAWTEMYMATHPMAVRVAMQLVKNKDVVEDMIQESYLSAYTKLDTLKEADKFQSWFNRIVANNCKNYLVKKKPKLFSEMGTIVDDGEEMEYDVIDDREEFHPESAVISDETKELFYEMIGKLPEDQRTCALMYWIQELTTHEIAETLGISENTVKSRLHYARKKMTAEAEEMKKNGVTVFSIDGFSLIPFLRWLFKQGSGTNTEPKNAIKIIKMSKRAKFGSGRNLFKRNSRRDHLASIALSLAIVTFIAALFIPHEHSFKTDGDVTTTTQTELSSLGDITEIIESTTLSNIEIDEDESSTNETVEEVTTALNEESTTLIEESTTSSNIITTTTTTTTTQPARELITDAPVTVLGINKYPYFKINELYAYCAEIQNKVPSTGMIYYEIEDSKDYSACDEVFIAASIYNGSGDEFHQVLQQMVWGALNDYMPDASIKKISDNALEIYMELKAIIENADVSEYTVEYRSFVTDEAPASGNAYQLLIVPEVYKN